MQAMQLELAKLKKDKTSKSRSAYSTPQPKIAAPSPSPRKSSPVHPAPPPRPPLGTSPPDAQPVPKTEAAKFARLRRLCEMKPSGRCAVPQAVRERWKKGDKNEREAMIEEFEKANWSKETWCSKSLFVDLGVSGFGLASHTCPK